MTTRYQVKPGKTCWHAGKEYQEGDILPEHLTLDELNTHLINVQIVDIVNEELPPEVHQDPYSYQDHHQ